MPLTLTLEGPGAGPAARETRTLGRGTLSIGRAPGNDWVLPDPERLLSKTHCVIAASGGRYVLTDLSTNGVFVNGAAGRVPRDGQMELTDGDEFRLGDYVIRVAETAAAPAAGHVPLAPGAVPRADPLADPGVPGPDPLADPLDPFDAPPPGFSHPIAAPAAPALRGSDPFDLADEAQPGRAVDPDDDLMRGIVPVDPWQGPSQADNADAPLQAFAAPRPILPASLDDLDIDALLGDEPPGAAMPAPAPHAAAAPLPLPLPPAPAAAAGRLLPAFLEGAGVAGLATGPDAGATLRGAGEGFR
ncbi:MAG: FHA domain-containing protein, partial [Rhodospirillales bacterium]|nr:FHA domain-containing protein [Rhodospirillales bacterium]